MRRFVELKVWQRAHALVKDSYRETEGFPDKDQFGGITSQLRRATVSVAANLAEGVKRSSRAEFARFVTIAEGSASEADYFVLLSAELGFMNEAALQRYRIELEEILRMLGSLRYALKKPGPKPAHT
jgi:four helix bundle protein